ncbi:MAG TPA: hypothetical protein VEX36_07755 [Thermoleophilaceae bacterium]|nr:hypothetical protein [Thermoleophilaceae bacterium]
MSPSAPTQSLIRMRCGERFRAALLMLALSFALTLVAGGPAADAAPKGPIAVFGSDGLSPAGIAVNQTSGDVYVVDLNGERVQRYDADGTFISDIGGPGVAEGQFTFGGTPAGVAVGLDGSLYVADTLNNRLQQFTADGTFVRTWGFGVQTGAQTFEICTAGCQPGVIPLSESPPDSGDGQFWSPRGVAVDPTDGDVLVADYQNSRVQRFSSTGTYESQFNGDGQFSNPVRVAVDSTGAIYVASDPDFGMVIAKFDSSGAFIASITQAPNSPTEVAVDPATNHVFIAQPAEGGSELVELDIDGALVDVHPTPAAHPVLGLAVNSSTGRIYVSDNGSGRVIILDDPVHTATIQDATEITPRSATLNGTLNPGGQQVYYHFEVSADDGETWTSFPESDDGPHDGSSDIPVSQPATGLEPNREYLVRLIVRNEFGFTVTSTVTTFHTALELPDATTLDAIQLRPTGATLAGEVNPNNAETTYRFEWGNTASYGSSIPVPAASAGADGAPALVSQQLDGLLPNTTYHYRIVATNEAGASFGLDRAFTTRPGTDSLDGSDAEQRGYELVSPAHKVGGVGVGHWYGGPDAVGYVGIAAYDGERFAVLGQNGSTIADGAFAYVNDWALAERTPEGWVHRPGVSRSAHGPQPTTDITLSSATPDLSLTGWGSAQYLKLFPEMADWNEENGTAWLLRRWSDPEYEIFGPTVEDYLTQETPSRPTHLPSVGQGAKAFAVDGSAAVVSMPHTRGLGGANDPTRPEFSDRDDDASSVFLDEVVGPFSDAFPGDDGVREVVNVCRGVGTERTLLPSGPCDPDPTGPDRLRLTHAGGASLSVGGVNPPASVISADGSRVFFMSPDPTLYQALSGVDSAQLFIRQRDVDGNVLTRWISRSEVAGQDESLVGRTLFEGASRDGDKVFFSTTAPLTDDDPNAGCGAPCTGGEASAQSWDLYMYDLPDGPDGKGATPDVDPAGGTLTRISRGPGGNSDCNVQPGTLRWLSGDASRAYFTCAAPLSGTVASAGGTISNPDGTTATSEASNLYLYDAATPSWTFVARLPRQGPLNPCATIATGRGSTISANPGGQGSDFFITDANSCVRGTPDGSLVTFITDGRLTADDPDGVSHDVYGYDTRRNELTRISAAQGGPGGSYPCEPRKEETSPRCHGDNGIGRGAMALEMLGVAARPGPDGDRMAFFESRSRLVAGDTDDSYDVYQWREGELSLISPGVSDPDGAFYVGNDRSGLNVYIATRDQLTWQDKDRVLDVYTARIGGGIPQPTAPPACPVLADGCRGGGAGQVGSQVDSTRPGGRNVAPGRRKTLSLGRLTSAQLKRAARTGRLTLRVRASGAGKLSVVARARVKGSTRVVGRASKRVAKPGLVTVTLRLTAQARGVLRSGRPLRVAVRVSQAGATPRSITVRLRRNDK